MKKFSGLDEFVAAEGAELGPTDWLEVTQDRVNLFAYLRTQEDTPAPIPAPAPAKPAAPATPPAGTPPAATPPAGTPPAKP